MATSKRYNTAKKLFAAGSIHSLSDLLDIVDPTPLARDIHTSPERLKKLLENPELFMFQDAYAIAQLIGVEERAIIDIIHTQYVQDKKAKRKK